jgi:predicted amidohydrolase YtcJ
MAYQDLRRRGELSARINIRPTLWRVREFAARSGVPPHVHAIGDLGNRIVLDVYERVLTEEGLLGRDHRWRVIHAQHVHPDDFARFGRLGLVAEVNPYHVADDMRWMEERIGSVRRATPSPSAS